MHFLVTFSIQLETMCPWVCLAALELLHDKAIG